MKQIFRLALILIILLDGCQNSSQTDLHEIFQDPPEEARSWVYWYWVKAAVSREGITADLEAMKEVGIAGAYLFFIQGADDPPLYSPAVEQLTPEWWKMVEFAFREAKRLGIKLALHACDGFTTAGGPWITPEMSMQKVVWSEIETKGDRTFHDSLPLPEIREGFYRDITVFAYPTPPGTELSSNKPVPEVTTSIAGVNAQYICDLNNSEVFRSEDPCWIQYEYEKPFLCRNVHIRTKGLNYQSHRLIIESSNDGIHFDSVCRLDPPRHGWQDFEEDITHAIPPTRAKYFRFVYKKERSEPGAEDLDAARWNSALKIRGIILSGKPLIHQFEGKNGSIWRISKKTNALQVHDSLCIPLEELLDISGNLDSTGVLHWEVPPGNWTILRIGHTSTGHTNYMGGGGKGLECDKFDPEVVKYQFDKWFERFYDTIGIASDVLKIFHVDSWECGSQNWSTVFREEFKNRRGYDLYYFLPVMTGLPLVNVETSEKFLHDIRETIAELITVNFFATMSKLAEEKGCQFSAESVAPVMVSDGIQYFSNVDIPMGEFWLNSPTHDKPMDILDAVSAAHIYDKPIVQAEAFTTLRMDWDEFPGKLKRLGDRNFTFGINRLVFHVFTHNPWMDRQPGMTLSGIGLYFQRDQTWWKASKEWISYLNRCQSMLQQGDPVTDIAVFTGEEFPRRSLTPERLTGVLPGLLGDNFIRQEKFRLQNEGIQMQEIPRGVWNSKNTFDIYNWPDPLRGYHYDSFDCDALLHLAEVSDGKIILPGGACYEVLVIPGIRKMDPDFGMSLEIAEKIKSLVQEGATVIFESRPNMITGMTSLRRDSMSLNNIINEFFEGELKTIPTEQGVIQFKNLEKGRILMGPFIAETMDCIGLARDFIAYTAEGDICTEISWTHRRKGTTDIYFCSNQTETNQDVSLSLRTTGKYPEIFDPVTQEIYFADEWRTNLGRTEVPVTLSPNGSVFIVLQKSVTRKIKKPEYAVEKEISGPWQVQFDHDIGGPSQPVIFNELTDWTRSMDHHIKYYSGTAVYSKTIIFKKSSDRKYRYWIDLGKVNDIAEIMINGKSCGITWTSPFRKEITGALKEGENKLIIKVTNTWHNRLIGDNMPGVEKKITWTTAPFRLNDEPLSDAGLLGPVNILTEIKN